MKGSVPPTWSGAFTYASTTSSLTWSWSGLTIYRADGTTTAVPERLAGRHRAFCLALPIIFILTGTTLPAALAWVAGGTGAPATRKPPRPMLAAQQQRSKDAFRCRREPWSRPPLRQGTGGGSGGGSGSCLRAGTVVLEGARHRRDRNLSVGEHLRCPVARPRGESWTRIVRLEVRDADAFIRLHFSNAESLDVTPHHIFTLADGSPMRAERLCLSDLLVGRFGRVTLKRIEAVYRGVAESDGELRAVAPVFRRPPRRDRAHAQLHVFVVSVPFLLNVHFGEQKIRERSPVDSLARDYNERQGRINTQTGKY